MKPHAAAAAAPQREAVQVGVTRAVPQATSVGVPVARPRPPKLPAAPTAQPAPAQRLTLLEQPPAPAPATDTVERPDRSIRVGQIVCWQFAVVAVGAATAGSRTALILTSAAAVSLVALTAIRIRGLWLYRWLGVLLVFLVRRRRIDLGDSIAVNLVSAFLGRTGTDEVTVREQPYGVLSRPAGASLALRLGPDAQHEVLRRLGSLADSADEQPVEVGVQLVLHTGVKQNQPPRAWIAVAAERTPDIATDDQLRQVLANTVRRLVRRFDREGVECLPLDHSDVLASLGALAHANAGRGQIHERWSTWSCGPVRQLCVRLSGSASLPAANLQALAAVLLGTGTGAAQTIAITVTGSADHHLPTRHDAVLRLAASHPATLDTAYSVLSNLARSFGVEPERLDGRHAAGVAATLPLGVPLS
ncbi:type VII secretion protein EccE [Kribbella sp. NPDC002412]